MLIPCSQGLRPLPNIPEARNRSRGFRYRRADRRFFKAPLRRKRPFRLTPFLAHLKNLLFFLFLCQVLLLDFSEIFLHTKTTVFDSSCGFPELTYSESIGFFPLCQAEFYKFINNLNKFLFMASLTV